jgi:hypothetical protein
MYWGDPMIGPLAGLPAWSPTVAISLEFVDAA